MRVYLPFSRSVPSGDCPTIIKKSQSTAKIYAGKNKLLSRRGRTTKTLSDNKQWIVRIPIEEKSKFRFALRLKILRT